MRILYLGLPLGALHLDGLGHRPVVAALGHPKAPGARRVRRRLGARGTLFLGRPDLQDPGVLRTLEVARPDVLLSWFWPTKIPPRVLALAPRGAFGVHPSLLPRWRGPDPYFWAIQEGDAETGVTLHRLEAAYDTGAIIAQERLTVAAEDDAFRLAKRLDRPSLRLLGEAADRLAGGATLTGDEQDPARATHAPRPTPEELAVDWRGSAKRVLALIRAAAPEPGATADFGGHAVDVLRAEKSNAETTNALDIAEARCVEGGVAVRVGDGAVKVTLARRGEERLEGNALHVLFEEETQS